MGTQQSTESCDQATGKDHAKTENPSPAPSSDTRHLSSVDRSDSPPNEIFFPAKSQAIDFGKEDAEDMFTSPTSTKANSPDDEYHPCVVTKQPAKTDLVLNREECHSDRYNGTPMGPDHDVKKDNRGSTLSQKNSVENNAVNVASSEKFESDKEEPGHVSNHPESESDGKVGNCDAKLCSKINERQQSSEEPRDSKCSRHMSESFPAPTPTPVPLKRQSKPTSVVTACQQMKFGPNLEGKEHESSRLFRYKRNLHEKDLAFSTDNEKKVVWIIGRFLASAQIGSTIIRKYHERGLGVDSGQKTMCFLLTSAFGALPSSARHFLLEDNHRHYDSPWMPYLQFARKGELSAFIKKSNMYQAMVRQLIKFKEKQGMDQSETTNGDKTDVVKRLINYRVKFEAPDKQKFTLILPEKEQTFGKKETPVQMDYLVGKFEPSNDSDLQFHFMNSTKPLDGDFKTELACLWNPCESKKVDPNNADFIIQNKKNRNAWPWSNDCENLVQKVICLVHCNSRFKSDPIKNLNDSFDSNKRSKSRGKRKSKGNCDHQNNVSQKKITTAQDEDSEWRHVSDTFTTSDVLFSGRALVIFPVIETASNTLLFFNGDSDTAAEQIYRIGNICLCDCQLKRKIITPNEPYAFCSISKNEWHHHDTLQINLLMPTSSSTRLDLSADIARIIHVFSEYMFSLREHAFQNRDMSIKKKVYEKHFQEYRCMCENIINFIIFSEECGPAELKLKATEYLTNARMHHESARDTAIEIGVFPTFIETLNSLVVTLPEQLKIVKNPSSYAHAFEFCDFRLSNQNLESNIKMENIVEPTCVGILETILGKNYLNHVDDELIYKAVTNQYDPKERVDSVAVVTPIHNKFSDSKCRLYETIKPAFTSDGLTDETRQFMDEKVLKICRNAYNSFVEKTAQDDKNSHSFESHIEPIWKHIHRFCHDLQVECEKVYSLAVRDEKGSQDPCENETTVEAECAETATSESEEVDKTSENSTTPSNDSKPQAGDSGKSSADGDAGKSQDKRKKSKEYMSPAKRQQRQVQRLREKWEKKHKASEATQQS